MPNPDNILDKQFQKGQSGNPNGRPKGVLNRSTVARKVLSLMTALPENQLKALIKLYPEINAKMTIEEIMTLIQANRAITKGDTAAYKALLDSAYGAPKQEIEQTSPITINLNKPKKPKDNDNI